MSAQVQQISQDAKINAGSDRNPVEDEFLSFEELVPVKRAAAERSLKQILSEMEELIHEKKWEDVAAVFFPVDEKLPELMEFGMDTEPRAKIAFALGQLQRFDDAIKELSICVQKDPDNFHYHSSLAYTAYDSLYAAKNRDIFLSGRNRAERVKLAHTHFIEARKLRPEGVTNFYREGMLYRQLENKTEKGLPLFEKAVFNWDSLDEEQRKARHQERKNFIKALYQLAGCLLETGRPKKGLDVIKRCLSEDEKSNYYSLVFKYFALGKIRFHLNCFAEAKDALLFALQCKENQSVDFVYELLARTYLAMENPDRALEVINQVTEKKRRPYYRWTEADVLCALKDFKGAGRVLIRSQERDNRSRHKALIRLAKIEYLTGNFCDAMSHAEAADKFFRKKWGNAYREGIFWQAISAYRAGEHKKALGLALQLKELNPYYPRLDRLLEKLS